jgi:ribosomal protein S18 acetylase RimI-like enzyme
VRISVWTAAVERVLCLYVGMLSNFFRAVTPDTAHPGPLQCRAAAPDELNDAMKMVLSSGGKPAGDLQVVDFLRYAVHRGIDLNDTWIAERSGHIVWATLPVINPGRTMLLLMPDEAPAGDLQAVTELLNAVCDYFGRRDIAMAQALLEPTAPITSTLASYGKFIRLAELIYLQGDIRRAPTAPAEGIHWQTYSAETHDRFARTILDTYEESLDCPALNGVRNIEDIISGHKGSGEFRPDLWLLANDPTGKPLGVLLLSPIGTSNAIELVYLGVCPAARGRRIGHALVRESMAIARSLRMTRLTLAVDSQNVPALRLYYGHGMQNLCSKVALMRDLRPTPNAAASVRSNARETV